MHSYYIYDQASNTWLDPQGKFVRRLEDAHTFAHADNAYNAAMKVDQIDRIPVLMSDLGTVG